MYSHMDSLVFFGCDFEFFVGAVFTEIYSCSIVEGRIECQMVVGGDIVYVKVDRCVANVLFEDVNGHKELAVIFISVASSVFHSL